ncbi:MAG: TRAP transporter substrate-binding protein [Chloroflexi bacterium]|nr:TRAP transporter substrate-binding protein [Chloroflexota bacterium]
MVAEKSKGAVVVRVFYQSLGVEQQLAQAVSAGSVDIGMLSNGNSGRFTTAYYIYDLPFLFKSYENVLKSLETPIGKQAIAQFEKDLGVKLLFPVSWGRGRDVQSRNKQLRTPADIKGLKIRVISSPVDLATFKAWGANPTPVDWAQTFTALQQGVVEGENIPFHLLLPSKHYEVIKHSTQLDYQAVFQQVYMNAKKFASLSPAQQSVLLDAARDTQPRQRRLELEKIERAAQDLQKLGVQLYTPTPQEYAQWAAIREKVWQEVAEEQKGKIDLGVAKRLYESQ